jgi:hypothetical protein
VCERYDAARGPRLEVRVIFDNGLELHYHADPHVAWQFASKGPTAGFRAEIGGIADVNNLKPLPCERLWR